MLAWPRPSYVPGIHLLCAYSLFQHKLTIRSASQTLVYTFKEWAGVMTVSVVWFVLGVSRPLVSPGGRGTAWSVYSTSRISFVIFSECCYNSSVFQCVHCVCPGGYVCVCVCVRVCVCACCVEHALHSGVSLSASHFGVSIAHTAAKDIPTVLIYGAPQHSSEPNEKPIRCL